LAARGRESLKDISARLAREGKPIPEGIAAITVDNSGPLADSAARFCAALLEASHHHIAEGIST
jgi:ribose 1,5-bisphosphokinase